MSARAWEYSNDIRFLAVSLNLHKHPPRWFIYPQTRSTINGAQIEFVGTVKENRHACTRREFDYQWGLARFEIDISGRAYFHRLLHLAHDVHMTTWYRESNSVYLSVLTSANHWVFFSSILFEYYFLLCHVLLRNNLHLSIVRWLKRKKSLKWMAVVGSCVLTVGVTNQSLQRAQIIFRFRMWMHYDCLW